MLNLEYKYTGPIFVGKASEQEKALADKQAAFYDTTTRLFQQQFANQQQTLNFLQGYLEPLIKNPTGYSPEAMTAMRTSASDTISQQYKNAEQNFQNRSFVLGARQLPSGALLKGEEAIQQAHAADEANAQNQITLSNEQLKQTNFWNAISALSGVGGMQNPSYLLSGANQAGANAWQSTSVAYAPSNFWGNLAGAALGGGLNAFTGGLGGTAASKLGGKLFG
jgi:hypothetical protein